MTKSTEKMTHFGYQQIPREQKSVRVAKVFHSVANKYDLMNDLMSFGMHRLWKNFTTHVCQLRPGMQVLDVAGGTGDLTARIANAVGQSGHVYLTDINSSMLQIGFQRLIDQGIFTNVSFIQADAEQLPFEDNYFDRIVIGFGLRNVTDKLQALRSMYGVLKPGGSCFILEFSKPNNVILQSLYNAYSFNILPWLGEKITHDADSYRYLAESIRMHPDQETLALMMQEAGFDRTEYFNLTGGIVALHKGYKY